jgi:hypothetical protein
VELSKRVFPPNVNVPALEPTNTPAVGPTSIMSKLFCFSLSLMS